MVATNRPQSEKLSTPLLSLLTYSKFWAAHTYSYIMENCCVHLTQALRHGVDTTMFMDSQGRRKRIMEGEEEK